MNVLPIGRRVRRKRGRGAAAAASGALLLAVLASLVGQTAPAGAVEAAPTPAPSPRAGAPADPSPTANPTANPSPAPSAAPDRKADQDALARELREAATNDPCPAALQPGTVTNCAVGQGEIAAFGITLPQQKDLLLVQIVATQDVSNPTVLAPDGTTVTCDDPVGPG
ncbi:hypothetical protein AB0E96_41095, partial [Kitasatospora sp. NPDC036755]